MGQLLDKYLFQALDAYPWDLEETVESLNYALSYDDKNPLALALMGRLHAEKLGEFETAKTYFEQAIAENIHAIMVYPHYINVLLWNEDFKEAKKLIDFALTVKGSDKGELHLKKVMLFEYKKNYKKALRHIKTARLHGYNDSFIEALEADENRIKMKLKTSKKNK